MHKKIINFTASLARSFLSWIQFHLLCRRVQSKDLALAITKARVDRSLVVANGDGGASLYVGRQLLPIINNRIGFLIVAAHKLLVDIADLPECVLCVSESKDRLYVDIKGIVFPCSNWEEVFIVHELIVKNVYALHLPTSNIILDIGANIGFSSVYLASINPHCRVISYEPLGVNQTRFGETMACNRHLEDRVELRRYALGAKSETRQMLSRADARGCSTLVQRDFSSGAGDVEKLVVEVKGVVEELRELLTLKVGDEFFIKMDCEGSEYEIIQSLIEGECLKSIRGVLLEWHHIDKSRSAMALVQMFLAMGFLLKSEGDFGGKAGMLLAVSFGESR